MSWVETFRTSLDAIRSHRLRSGLTMLGILIGIAAVMLTVGLGQGASAQVKSALILGALGAAGRSRIVQSALTRDHTEKMLKAFGADISVETLPKGEAVYVMGEVELKPCSVDVPRDPSSAAFPLVAALIVPGSEVTMPGVLALTTRASICKACSKVGLSAPRRSQTL